MGAAPTKHISLLREHILSFDNQLDLLKSHLPDWAAVKSRSQFIVIEAKVPRPMGGFWNSVTIEISTSANGKLQAREFPANQWPTFCPQRHINHEGHFCLGLSEVPTVTNAATASRWWQILQEHLGLQFTADATRTWPPHLEWDHGEAGATQVEMESLATKNGMAQDVTDAHFYRVGWLAAKDLPRLTKAKDRLVKGRAPCPKGCQKRGHPILRRKCSKREAVFQLVKLEWQKRKQATDFWKEVEGQPCCGRMKNCPLK
jgi:hypothetical protein